MARVEKEQTLWWVCTYAKQGRPVTVVSVGRKWATLSNRVRIDIETLRADAGGHPSPGKCYTSQEVFDAEVLRDQVWQELQSRLASHRICPAYLPTETMQQILALLDAAKATS